MTEMIFLTFSTIVLSIRLSNGESVSRDDTESYEVVSSPFMSGHINGTKVLVLGVPGADEIQLFTVLTVFSKAKLYTQFAGLNKTESRSGRRYRTQHGMVVVPNRDLRVIKYEQPYDMIVLPGGVRSYGSFMHHPEIVQLIKDQNKAFRYIAAMETALVPLLFHEVGLGKQITYPIPQKNIFYQDYALNNIDVVQDGHLITCRASAAAMEFALHVVEMFKGKAVANAVAKQVGHTRNKNNIKVVKPHIN